MNPSFFSRTPEGFGGKIPFPVTKILARLREVNAISEKGIFRCSGGHVDGAKLAADLDRGCIVEWPENVHTIAVALKRYVRNSGGTVEIFSGDVRDRLMTLPTMVPEDMVATFRAVIDDLSRPMQMTLALIFEYLKEVVEAVEINLMTEKNLGVVFAPNFFEQKIYDALGSDVKDDTARQAAAIELLIVHSKEVFSGVTINEDDYMTDEDIEIVAVPTVSGSVAERMARFREIRSKSMIPFVPFELLNTAEFVRPTRVVTFND